MEEVKEIYVVMCEETSYGQSDVEAIMAFNDYGDAKEYVEKLDEEETESYLNYQTISSKFRISEVKEKVFNLWLKENDPKLYTEMTEENKVTSYYYINNTAYKDYLDEFYVKFSDFFTTPPASVIVDYIIKAGYSKEDAEKLQAAIQYDFEDRNNATFFYYIQANPIQLR